VNIGSAAFLYENVKIGRDAALYVATNLLQLALKKISRI
jgi:hypothetical protein